MGKGGKGREGGERGLKWWGKLKGNRNGKKTQSILDQKF